MDKKIKTAIVGFGKSGSIFHLPILECLNEYEIKSVVSSDEKKVKKRLPDVEVYSSLDELLDKSPVDLVIITSPNHLHYEQAKKCILKKKHVVVEKPFVLDTHHGKELISLADEQNIKLTVYHNRRWDSGFLTLKKIIHENKLGKINLHEIRFDRYRPAITNKWREDNIPGSGILWDLGSHLIDQALCLYGIPNSILADTAIQKENGKTIDYFHIILIYNTLRVILRSSSLSHIKTPHLTVQGEKGVFVRHEMDSQEEALKSGKNPNSKGWGKDTNKNTFIYTNHGSNITSEEIESETGSYEIFYIELAKSIRENTPVPVDPQKALEVVNIIQFIEKNSLHPN